MLMYLTLFSLLLFVISFLFGVFYGIKGNLVAKRYYQALKNEGKVSGFLEALEYVKERNPRGVFVKPETMRKNLLKGNDSQEIEVLVNKQVDLLRVFHRCLFLSAGLSILSNILYTF